jgi:TPR repeat protein
MKSLSYFAGISISLCLAGLTASDVTDQPPSVKAVDEAEGNAEADYQLGKRLFLGDGMDKDPVRAAQLIRSAAESGHAEAQGYYGFLLSRGTGVPQDEAAAATWIGKAAEAGVDSAQLNLGLMMLKGIGGKRDVTGAITWITKAAKQGNSDAAALWYRRAAEQGNAKAQASLGRLLAGGLIGKRDAVEAYYWLWQSMEQNEPNAANFLTDLVKGMTPEERKGALMRIGVKAEAE